MKRTCLHLNGLGWGDGNARRAAAQKRTKNIMAKKTSETYTSFRPWNENEAAYYVIKAWLNRPNVNRSWSSLLNSILPYIKTSIEHTVEIKDGEVSIELNLGRITLR